MAQVKHNNFIRTILSIPDSDYLFFCDADGKSVEDKRAELLSQYDFLSSSKLFIVQYEIESWYYAGVAPDVCKKLKTQAYPTRYQYSIQRTILFKIISSKRTEICYVANTDAIFKRISGDQK